jgi:hypothetical protein
MGCAVNTPSLSQVAAVNHEIRMQLQYRFTADMFDAILGGMYSLSAGIIVCKFRIHPSSFYFQETLDNLLSAFVGLNAAAETVCISGLVWDFERRVWWVNIAVDWEQWQQAEIKKADSTTHATATAEDQSSRPSEQP